MTRVVLGSVVLLALVCGKVAAADSHESLLKDRIKAMNDIATALETVTDKKTAEAASEKIQKLAATIKDLGKREGKLPALDKDKAEALKARHQADLSKARSRFRTVAAKLADDKEAAAALKTRE